MNEISIKQTCPCGATFELTAESTERAWLTKQSDQWQKEHHDCLPVRTRIELATRPPSPQPSPQGEGGQPTDRTETTDKTLCGQCGYTQREHLYHYRCPVQQSGTGLTYWTPPVQTHG